MARGNGGNSAKIILWMGPKHSGKSTRLLELSEHLKKKGFKVCGLLAPSVYDGADLIGFDGVDLSDGRREALLKHTQAGGFAFTEQGLELGRGALNTSAVEGADLVVVDEFGPFELSGGGWRECVDLLVESARSVVLLVVRRELAEDVEQLYRDYSSVRICAMAEDAAERVISILKENA